MASPRYRTLSGVRTQMWSREWPGVWIMSKVTPATVTVSSWGMMTRSATHSVPAKRLSWAN